MDTVKMVIVGSWILVAVKGLNHFWQPVDQVKP